MQESQSCFTQTQVLKVLNQTPGMLVYSRVVIWVRDTISHQIVLHKSVGFRATLEVQKCFCPDFLAYNFAASSGRSRFSEGSAKLVSEPQVNLEAGNIKTSMGSRGGLGETSLGTSVASKWTIFYATISCALACIAFCPTQATIMFSSKGSIMGIRTQLDCTSSHTGALTNAPPSHTSTRVWYGRHLTSKACGSVALLYPSHSVACTCPQTCLRFWQQPLQTQNS